MIAYAPDESVTAVDFSVDPAKMIVIPGAGRSGHLTDGHVGPIVTTPMTRALPGTTHAPSMSARPTNATTVHRNTLLMTEPASVTCRGRRCL